MSEHPMMRRRKEETAEQRRQKEEREYRKYLAFRRVLGKEGERTPEQQLVVNTLTAEHDQPAWLFAADGHTDAYLAAWRSGATDKARQTNRYLNGAMPPPPNAKRTNRKEDNE